MIIHLFSVGGQTFYSCCDSNKNRDKDKKGKVSAKCLNGLDPGEVDPAAQTSPFDQL